MKLTRETKALWREAGCDFHRLLQLNKKFVLGQIEGTPYHPAPLYKDSSELSPDLALLHDFGLMTVEGQSGMDEIVHKNNHFIQTKQKAFMFLYE